MLRISLMGLLTAVCLTGMPARAADDSSLPVYEGRLRQRHEEQIRRETAEELRIQRGHIRARQRLRQELANERLGRTPLRPHTNTAYWATGLER